MKSSENYLFRKFVIEMDSLIKENIAIDAKSQRQALNELFKVEREFKKILLSTKHGELAYSKFMEFILEDKSNMLTSRVYFREKQETFSSKMFKAFHKNEPKRLYKFRINYLFASWIMKVYKGPHRKKLNKLLEKMAEIRRSLCENNLPLAINRAKLFWKRVPESHLEYMDLIQTASEGLINAIDKFVPPYKTVFRSVAIGRMTLNMSTDYSSTTVKLPPKERRILYRATMAKRKNDSVSSEEVAKYVNESFKGVTESDIRDIEAAASQVINIDDKEEGSFSMSETLADPSNSFEQIEAKELKVKLMKLLSSLKALELKVVLLKNGSIDNIF